MSEEARETTVGTCVRIIEEAIGVEASSEMPLDRDAGAPYVQVSRTGGEDGEFIDRPIMTLMCWAASDQAAYMLAEDCLRAVKEAAKDDEWMSACEMVSMSRDQWTPAGAARYMLQMRLTINKP